MCRFKSRHCPSNPTRECFKMSYPLFVPLPHSQSLTEQYGSAEGSLVTLMPSEPTPLSSYLIIPPYFSTYLIRYVSSFFSSLSLQSSLPSFLLIPPVFLPLSLSLFNFFTSLSRYLLPHLSLSLCISLYLSLPLSEAIALVNSTIYLLFLMSFIS